MPTIKNPVTIIQGGTPAPTRPTTWAEFKALSTTAAQALYPEGSVVDIACTLVNLANTSQTLTWDWIVASYGTCRLENDTTDYPCVTLVSRDCTPGSYAFDQPEQTVADSTTEPTAVAGTYYYGTQTASGTPATADTTALNLTAGDTIPYGDYARILKSSINTTVGNFRNLWSNGYNNYPLSNIRQWLNADAAGSSWFTPSHVGDTAPSYQTQPGFLYCLPSDFKAVISATAVDTVLNPVTDGGVTETTYDKIFLPSQYELRCVSSPVEGTIWAFVQRIRNRIWSSAASSVITFPNTQAATNVWLRSASRDNVGSSYYVYSNGSPSSYNASYTCCVAPACRIILAS